MAVSANSITAPKIPTLRPKGCPVGVEPVAWRRAISGRLEALMDKTMALIAALDEMDGDPDLEDNADAESSLGGHEIQGQVDLEQDNSDYEPDADLEPSLGAPEIGATVGIWQSTAGCFVFGASQERWANGSRWCWDEEEAVNEDGEDADYDSGMPIRGGSELL